MSKEFDDFMEMVKKIKDIPEISDEEIEKIARELANIPHNRPFDDEEKDYKDYQRYEGVVVGIKWCLSKLKLHKTELYEENTEVFGCCNMKDCICTTEQEMNIEISDEEIHKAGIELSKQGKDLDYRWIEGAKWYREQLKKKQ